MSTSKSKPDLRQTAQKLSDSYYALLQYNTLSTEAIAQHVQQLASYSNDLPFSWFTAPFIDALLALKVDINVVTLLGGWSRRLAGAPDVLYTMRNRLVLVLQLFQKILVSGDMKLQKEAWIGYVAVIGHSPTAYPDTSILEEMTKMIGMYTKDKERVAYLGENLDAGLAHALANTNALNEFEMASCQSLLEAYIQFAAAREEGPRALMHALEHAVDVRSQGKPEAKAEAEVIMLVKMVGEVVEEDASIQVQFSRLAMLAGVVRTLQFNQGVKTKKVLAARKEAEKTFIQQLDISATALLATRDQLSKYQDTVSFLAGRCLLQIPNDTIATMNVDALLKVLTGTLFASPSTLQNGEALHRDEKSLKALVEQPLFKDLGRISRILAKLIQVVIDKEEGPSQIQYIIEKMVGLSYNIYFDWDHHQLYNRAENKQLGDAAAWTYLKTVSFSFTVLLKSIAVDIPDGRGLVLIPNAAQDIISIYGNLHFITEQVEGGAGVEAYQDTLTNSVAYLLHKDHQCQLDRFISLAFKEYGNNAFTTDDTSTVELLSNTKQYRLTFFTDLVEQVVGSLDDKVFENDILPVIYPILKWKKVENKNLYESAHTAVISAFIAEKPVSRELAGVYGKILIDNFPEPMNLDQFRYGFNTLIQALCGLDDALAWLTVNQLVLKIESLPLESQLRKDYTIALIDMLKPLSLGPFFPRILDKVEELVLANKEGMSKILFETVSGSGISDMRRAEAVGWFLELKHKL